MDSTQSIRHTRAALADGQISPAALAEHSLHHANSNPGRNTYLWIDPAWTKEEARRVSRISANPGCRFDDGRGDLWGIPVSIKDCFDLAGSPTSCGVVFYRDLNGRAEKDSWLAGALRSAGAIITGKTHLHPLAYGITGENPEFGDCEQPGIPGALTGGSSSGAAASVLEGSAMAAIGTDTGGSIRAPAALCGLAGYRASIGRGNWQGGAHLAESFDTMGWLFRDLEDGPLLGATFAPETSRASGHGFTKFAFVHDEFLHDCEPAILENYRLVRDELSGLGLTASRIDVPWWAASFEIYATIQAAEAARIHNGYHHRFPASIRERLEWGARISDAELGDARRRHAEFRDRIDELLVEHELVLVPASPVARLTTGIDHSQTRRRILRYTTPFSLSGTPVVMIPGHVGGMQLTAHRESDEDLLELASSLGAQRRAVRSARRSMGSE